jgi:hypothetical protein
MRAAATKVLARPSVVFGLRAGSLVLLIASLVVFGFGYTGGDALTYLAAGERLNAGHQLYALSPGDRPIALWHGSPLVYPPFVAVAWRPLAAIGEAVMLPWALLTVLTLFGAWFYALWRAPLLALLLTMPVAYDHSHGNVNGLLACLTIAAFHLRPPLSGLLLSVATAIKLLPVLVVPLLLAHRRWRILAWIAIGLFGMTAVSIAGAGLSAHLDYLHGAQASLRFNALAMFLGFAPWVASPDQKRLPL